MLTRWRDGRVAEVELHLPVMGSDADTAPYDCPKSQKILDEACRFLAAPSITWPRATTMCCRP